MRRIKGHFIAERRYAGPVNRMDSLCAIDYDGPFAFPSASASRNALKR